MIPQEIIILAGGEGSRLKSITGESPKCLAPVAGKPFLHWLLHYLHRQGVCRWIFALGKGAGSIKAWLQQDADIQALMTSYNISVVFSEEQEPLGTGGALLKAMPLAKAQHVLATNADSIFLQSLQPLADLHLSHHAAITLSLVHMADASRFGLVQCDDHNRVVHFAEKQSGSSGWINAGMYLIDRHQITIPSTITHCSLEKDIMPQLLAQQKLFAVKSEGYFTDIGVPEDYFTAQTDLPKWIPA